MEHDPTTTDAGPDVASNYLTSTGLSRVATHVTTQLQQNFLLHEHEDLMAK
jgi:hypothetical protein